MTISALAAIVKIREMSQSGREALRSNKAFLDRLATKDFTNPQVAEITVRLLLRTPPEVTDPEAATMEAVRLLSQEVGGDKDVCRRLIDKGVKVVIVPKNKGMTTLPEFKDQAGKKTFDGRSWDTVRGLGGQNTAITEENLLGGSTTVAGAGDYCKGYSTTTHEFAHTIHMFGMSDADKGKIQQAYDAKRKLPTSTDWVDGPRKKKDGTDQDCYASMTVFEYFAQNANAFKGTNAGTDPYTGQDRHNDPTWVQTNEPDVYEILTRIMISGTIEANDAAAVKKAAATGKLQQDADKASVDTPAPQLNDQLMIPLDQTGVISPPPTAVA